MEVYPHCENNHCEDPTLLSRDIKAMNLRTVFDNPSRSVPAKIKLNDRAYIPSKVEERDGLWTTQNDARPELAFISQPPGITRNTYIYDATPARRVRVYLLDGAFIDTSLSVSKKTGPALLSHVYSMFDC